MGTFVSPVWLRRLAWSAALLIIGLNGWLVMQALAPADAGLGRFAIGLMAVLCGVLLAWIAFSPLHFTPAGVRPPANDPEDNVLQANKSAPMQHAAAG
jgi:hypothetical protein